MKMFNEDKGLKTINIRKTELLKKLCENKEKHEKDYKIALSGFRVDCLDKLKDAMKDAKKGLTPNNLSFGEPSCHSEDYQTMIEMLEMSVDDELEITYEQFKRYVKDEWEWKRSFDISAALYSDKATI